MCEMVEASQALTIGCAQVGFGDATLGPVEVKAFVTLDGSQRFPKISTALLQFASGKLPTVSASLPSEMQQLLSGIIEVVREG